MRPWMSLTTPWLLVLVGDGLPPVLLKSPHDKCEFPGRWIIQLPFNSLQNVLKKVHLAGWVYFPLKKRVANNEQCPQCPQKKVTANPSSSRWGIPPFVAAGAITALDTPKDRWPHWVTLIRGRRLSHWGNTSRMVYGLSMAMNGPGEKGTLKKIEKWIFTHFRVDLPLPSGYLTVRHGKSTHF